MNIVYTLNDSFVPQVAASICSVCENNKSTKITFYLISDGISAKNQQKLKKFVASYDQKLEIIALDNLQKYFNFEFDTSGWNPIVLSRLVLDQLLPKTVERVLYLDGDTIVRGSLTEMYNVEMGKSVIGMGVEPTADRARKQVLDIEGVYYNAGVLLIDLKKWRIEKTGQRILEFYAAHDGKLFSNDQDAINGALNGEIFTLAPKYNFCNIYHQYPYRFLKKLVAPSQYFSKTEFNESVKNPIIIHFLGEERPWRAGNTHKYRADYKKYLTITPWSDTPDDQGWQLYFVCWNIFNVATKLFPALRYKIITALIPKFLAHRAKQNQTFKNATGGGTNSKVSILIPAYNVEKLVHKAIKSALSQTHRNIEIILIDDGSTDKTWCVLQEFQKQYPDKVRVFTQENQGAGATRNTLLDKATGDYLVYLDADDWLKKDYVERMLTTIASGDIAICGFERYDADYQFRDQRIPVPGSYAKYRFCTTAGKMFRTDFLRRNNLYHKNDISMGDDAFMNICAYAKTSKIAIVPYGGYCCYENKHSMAQTAKYTEASSYYTVMKKLVAHIDNSATLRDPEFHFFILKNLIMNVFLYKNSVASRQVVSIYHASIDWYQDFLRQNNAKFRMRFQKDEPFILNLTVNGFVFLTKIHLDSFIIRIVKRLPIYIL